LGPDYHKVRFIVQTSQKWFQDSWTCRNCPNSSAPTTTTGPTSATRTPRRARAATEPILWKKTRNLAAGVTWGPVSGSPISDGQNRMDRFVKQRQRKFKLETDWFFIFCLDGRFQKKMFTVCQMFGRRLLWKKIFFEKSNPTRERNFLANVSETTWPRGWAGISCRVFETSFTFMSLLL